LLANPRPRFPTVAQKTDCQALGNESLLVCVLAGVRPAETNGSALHTARVLIVARRTAAGTPLLDAVARRARQGPCNFTLLVPASHRPMYVVGQRRPHDDLRAEQLIATAVPLLTRAARSEVVAVIGAHDPLAAVRDALRLMEFDEVIVSMLSPRTSAWLRLGLPRQIRALGVPVTEVIGSDSPLAPLSAA
jgi:hypothetical protein